MTPSSTSPAARTCSAEPPVFEHPLNERIRSFLRLERVIDDARERIPSADPSVSSAALTSLIELATLTERRELKREILSELERQKIVLAQLQDSTEIDRSRLQGALEALENAYRSLEAQPERLGQRLRSNDFLASVRRRTSIPGGTCCFDLPSLHHWLTRTPEDRTRDLSCWFEEMGPVTDALRVLLQHTREAGVPESAIATGGIYEYVPPVDNPPALLRLRLDADHDLFPQVSAGRHRITVQFQRWAAAGERAEIVRQDVPFTLTLCRF